MPLIRNTGIVLDVRYDPSTSTFKDYSRNHHTITNNNVTPVRGKFGGAGVYNGTTSYLNCGNASSLNFTDAITIEAWVKPILDGTFKTIFSNVDNQTKNGLMFRINASENLRLQVGRNIIDNPYNLLDTTLIDATRHHVVAVDDGTHLRIYLDGKEKCFSNVGAHSLRAPTENSWIGKDIWSKYFNGTIEGIKMYNHAQSAAEIAKHYLSKGYYGTLVEAPIPIL